MMSGRNIRITISVFFTTWVFIQIINGIFSLIDSTIAWVSSNFFIILLVAIGLLWLYGASKS